MNKIKPRTDPFSTARNIDSRPAPRARILFAFLDLWLHRARSRRELARLEPRLLADIGISLADARREAAKPFWKA